MFDRKALFVREKSDFNGIFDTISLLQISLTDAGDKGDDDDIEDIKKKKIM